MVVLLGLCSSVLWGAADFVGGRLSRRLPAYAVIFVAQSAALAGTAVLVAAGLPAAPDVPGLAWGAVAGAAGVVALGAFYRALAIGRMGLVAPIAATSVAVPVLVGVVQGQAPPLLQCGGLALAAVGTCVAVGPELNSGPRAGAARSVGLALLAAAGFGVVLVGIALGSRTSVPQTLLGQRTAYVVLVGVILLVMARARRGKEPSVEGEGGGWTPARLAAAVVVGLGDMVANLLYAHTTRSDLLPVVAVLASLYPVVTVVLAGLIDKERLRRLQLTGVVATFIGVALIGAQ